jgi:hypothetical protein
MGEKQNGQLSSNEEAGICRKVLILLSSVHFLLTAKGMAVQLSSSVCGVPTNLRRTILGVDMSWLPAKARKAWKFPE